MPGILNRPRPLAGAFLKLKQLWKGELRSEIRPLSRVKDAEPFIGRQGPPAKYVINKGLFGLKGGPPDSGTKILHKK